MKNDYWNKPMAKKAFGNDAKDNYLSAEKIGRMRTIAVESGYDINEETMRRQKEPQKKPQKNTVTIQPVINTNCAPEWVLFDGGPLLVQHEVWIKRSV